MSTEYDVIVLGGGSTGENVAHRAVKGGLSAVVIEEERVGGECSYWACMPSKALLRPLQAVAAARAVAGARAAVSGTIDLAAVLARRDAFASHWDDARQVRWLQDNHIDLVRGHGRLAGALVVEVTDAQGRTNTLRARRGVAVCTGSEAALPPIPGLAEVRPWTSREATSAAEAPRRLAIIGGGVVACEMATAWRGLGSSEVTILERGPRLLSGLEPFVGEMLRSSLETSGVQVRTQVEVCRVERGEQSLRLHLRDGTSLEADQILAATGRAPRTRDLGLESVGLRPGSWLDVDDSMRVRGVEGDWLYAAGDVNHRALLTHMGKYQARICGDAIVARAAGRPEARDPVPWSRWAATADTIAVPQVIFTDPEIAAVGLTEQQARAQGMPVRIVDYDIGRIGGAFVYADDYDGKARMIVDESRQVIVGATLIGPAVGELLHAATVAIVGAVPLDRLWHAVPSYPTISEVWLRLLEGLGL